MRDTNVSRRLIAVAVAWLCCAVCLLAQGMSVSNQLKHFRGVYEAEVKKILEEGNAKLKSWPEDYIQEIGALRAKATKAGDLDGVLAVDAELKRFKQSKDFPDQVLASTPEMVRALQLSYRDKPKQLLLERDQKVIEFAARYRERLTTMQTDLTKANKIEDALLVNAEIKRLAASAAVTAAEFTIAEEDAKKKKTEVAVTPPDHPPLNPPVPVRAGPVPDAGSKPPPVATPIAPPETKKSTGLASGFKMLEKLAVTGLKALPLSATGQLRMPKVRVDIAMDEKDPGDSGGGGGVYGSYRYRSGNTRLVFNASVRATSSNEYENAKMVIQYFTKPATSKIGGRIEPLEALKVVTPLPRITSQPFTVECPPFQYWSSTSKYRSAYYSSNYKSGDDFYGGIVSVFDDDGKLLFQGCSVNSLDKLGIDSP